MPNKIDVALVDDHTLLRNGLANLIESFGDYKVIFEADHGKDFLQRLKPKLPPRIVLMDINMPVMDGYEACLWLKKNHPGIMVLALSMYDNENAVIRMFKAGAKGYILKDCDPIELKTALHHLVEKGFYYSEMVTGKLIHSINSLDEHDNASIRHMGELSDREIQFLKLACTEFTYKEIADQLYLSPRTIDGYRDDLFHKLKVKTRVGLVLYAIKNGIVNV